MTFPAKAGKQNPKTSKNDKKKRALFIDNSPSNGLKVFFLEPTSQNQKIDNCSIADPWFGYVWELE